MSDLSREKIASGLASLALEAARGVAPYLLKAFRAGTSFSTKVDYHDPVTEHDRATEATLQQILAHFLPGSHAFGEEHGVITLQPFADSSLVAELPDNPLSHEELSSLRDLASRIRWIIDPIDGTANFAAGIPWFCTSIGVYFDNTPIAGAIVAPALDQYWVADATELRTNSTPTGTFPSVSPTHALAENQAVLICYYPGSGTIKRDRATALTHEVTLMDAVQTIRRTGAAALDLAHIASGRCGAMMGFGFGPWDIAAGLHMLTIAGGSFVNPLIEKDLAHGLQSADLPEGLRPAVLACAPGLQMPTVRRVFDEIVDLRGRR